MTILALIGGMLIGFAICGSVISQLLNKGKLETALKFLEVKRQYAEVTPAKTDPPRTNPDLYYKQPPDKKTPNN